jgi:Spy/CpxP family protein refolding chaperone
MVVMVTAFAMTVLAQEKGPAIGAAPAGDAKRGTMNTSMPGKTVPSFGRGPVHGGTVALLSSAQDSLRSLSFGGVPQAYAVLGLTDEQTKTIEALCKEGRAEYSETYKNMAMHGQTSPEEYQKKIAERREKQAAISAKYDLRMGEILTAEQKAQLSKIKALAEQKSAEDKKIAETAAAASKEALEMYKKKLYAILPPEQAKKIEEQDQASKQNADVIAPKPATPPATR